MFAVSCQRLVVLIFFRTFQSQIRIRPPHILPTQPATVLQVSEDAGITEAAMQTQMDEERQTLSHARARAAARRGAHASRACFAHCLPQEKRVASQVPSCSRSRSHSLPASLGRRLAYVAMTRAKVIFSSNYFRGMSFRRSISSSGLQKDALSSLLYNPAIRISVLAATADWNRRARRVTSGFPLSAEPAVPQLGHPRRRRRRDAPVAVP